ncbi:MAG: LLM class flavin-dependent oxidoreductase [Hyphomicrobiaceae bacterium]|nr:LLM class flavin-dependent oxidoreductase [Hyphomicrobiaceae bacterium]
MHFGQFNLMGYRHRGTGPHEVFDLAVDQVKVAEQAGFEIAWFAEHHFSNYSICPSPLMMVARLAGETRRIRLGPAVVVAPLYNPARLLAEVGMVDSLTHGRLVLGLGSGYQAYEFDRFGEDLAEAPARLVELTQMLDLAFVNDTFSYDGQHLKLPLSHIATRPYAGLPEIWYAGENPGLLRLAASRGAPLMLSVRHYSVELMCQARARVEAVWREVDAPLESMRLAFLRPMCIVDTRAEADVFLENLRHQMRLSHGLRAREQDLDRGMLRETPYAGEPDMAALGRHLLVGDAETVAERLVAEIIAARPHHYLLQFQVGGLDGKVALRSIERFASEVRPRLEKTLGPLDRL